MKIGTGLIQHEAKSSALLASRPRLRATFPIVHERKRCFHWFSVIYGAIQKRFCTGGWRDNWSQIVQQST